MCRYRIFIRKQKNNFLKIYTIYKNETSPGKKRLKITTAYLKRNLTQN